MNTEDELEDDPEEGENGLQSGEGYKCKCGFVTDNVNTYRGHLMTWGKKEPGEHAAEGRVDLQTGEITMPAYTRRNSQQKAASREAVKSQDRKQGKAGSFKTTEVLGQASQIKFVPRIMTCAFTPIMQAALTVDLGEDSVFKWRENMPFENWLDTIIYHYHREHGVTLAAYVVDDAAFEEEEDPEEPPDETEYDVDDVPTDEPAKVFQIPDIIKELQEV